MMATSKHRLEHGAQYPYDGGAVFWEDRTPTPPPATDWAHSAARGVLADLCDRRGIKWALEDERIDHETRAEIVQSMAAIIRLAHDEQQKADDMLHGKPAGAGWRAEGDAMTDLVQRLRTRNGNAAGFGLGPVCDEAADEIERLRAELNGARHEADAWRAKARDKGDASRRNLERDTALLRQALVTLEDLEARGELSGMADWDVATIAALRERLGEKT